MNALAHHFVDKKDPDSVFYNKLATCFVDCCTLDQMNRRLHVPYDRIETAIPVVCRLLGVKNATGTQEDRDKAGILYQELCAAILRTQREASTKTSQPSAFEVQDAALLRKCSINMPNIRNALLTRLTPQRKQVLVCIAQGLKQVQIAAQLGLNPNSVRATISVSLSKLCFPPALRRRRKQQLASAVLALIDNDSKESNRLLGEILAEADLS